MNIIDIETMCHTVNKNYHSIPVKNRLHYSNVLAVLFQKTFPLQMRYSTGIDCLLFSHKEPVQAPTARLVESPHTILRNALETVHLCPSTFTYEEATGK